MLGVSYLGVPLPYINYNWISLGSPNSRLNVPIPHALIFAAGVSSLTHIFRQITCARRYLTTWIYSWFNASRYLQPQSDLNEEAASLDMQASQPNAGPPMRENVKTSFAVIYGCNNKAGRAFALFLANKGFNLILIERDAESI